MREFWRVSVRYYNLFEISIVVPIITSVAMLGLGPVEKGEEGEMVTGIFSKRRRQEFLVFEVTKKCNHECLHCYNAWKNSTPYVGGDDMETAATLEMLGRAVDQMGARLVTLTGGEPMLRKDIYTITDFLCDKRITVNLISNGSLLDEKAVEKFLPNKISIFELPLLSVEREIHDKLSGRSGAFDDVTMAVANLKAANQRVVCVFVATRLNLPTFRQTCELAIALGADGMMFNRFNPGGEGIKNITELQATPEEYQAAMDTAEEISASYSFPISCSIAMPPCLFDTAKYKKLTFGFCAAGTERAYYTLDPCGNIRPCNHSPTILGNILTQDFWTMADGAAMKKFMQARPPFCSGCKLEMTCLGGCKAAAEAHCGNVCGDDPFLAQFKSMARKK